MKKNLIFLLSVLLITLFTGCSQHTNEVTIPNFKKEFNNKEKNIIVVTPDIKVFEVGVSSVEEIQEWTKKAVDNIYYSFTREIGNFDKLNNKELDFKSLTNEEKKVLNDTNKLMHLISDNIWLRARTNSIEAFDEKVKNFDYTIGNTLTSISNENDLFLFINGFDRVQSEGKKAVETTKLIVGALFGIAMGDIGGFTYSSAALVEGKTGKVLWHNSHLSKGILDLRKEVDTDLLSKELLGVLHEKI